MGYPTAFAGQARYLELAVRCPPGSGEFTVLGRQALTAAPYAANGVPSGEFILSSSPIAPIGYTYSGMQVTPDHRWSPKAPLSSARNGSAAVTVNNKIYLIGGGGAGYLDTVEEYDPATNTWSSKAPMPTARSGAAAVAVNNKIYAIGGNVNNGASQTTVEEYDPATNTWSSKAPMPTARYDLAAAAVNDKIYAIGDFTSGPLATVEEYHAPSALYLHQKN